MKRSLLWIVVLVLSMSMVAAFSLYGCKQAEEAAAPAEEEVAEEEAIPAEEEEAISTEEETEEEINLTYWAWGAGVDGMKGIVAPAFQELHPNVNVEAISMGPWDLMDKFYVSLVSGTGAPDCAQLVRRQAEKYLISELLYDFTDFVNVENEGQFIEDGINEATSPDGKILAIPTNYGPGVIYYDINLAEELGIDVNNIVTWDDYYNIAVEVSEAHPDIYIQSLFYPGGAWGSNYWKLFIQGAGANIYDVEGKVIRDNEMIKEINRFYYKLHTDVSVLPGEVQDPIHYDAIREGKMLFLISASWKAGEFKANIPEREGEIGTIPWPLWSKDALPITGAWGGEGLVVPKNMPNAEMAAELMKFDSTNVDVAKGLWTELGLVPGYKPAREAIANEGLPSFATNLMEAVTSRKVSVWNTYDQAQTEKILGDALDSMMAGTMTPDEAWDWAEGQLIKILGR